MTGLNKLPCVLIPYIFKSLTIFEIYNFCISKICKCAEIHWGQILRQNNIPLETLTTDDYYLISNLWSDFKPHNDLTEYSNNLMRINHYEQKDCCAIFFKYISRILRRTDDDINDAVKTWCDNQMTALIIYGPIKMWNTSAVTNMGELFWDATAFNEDIGEWDVSAVTNMRNMFLRAKTFNKDIGKWNVSKVTNMDDMFWEAIAFDKDIGEWDVSAVTTMKCMFLRADTFNKDIGKWNVSKVTNMNSMFRESIAFNQDISKWDVSVVTNMQSMFLRATAFNQDIDTLIH